MWFCLFWQNLSFSRRKIILIPTTAGTGSEVNPYAVLTLDGQDKKWTFKDYEQAYAKYAFLDARYTDSLSEKYTLSCALDAFAHCAESFLSPKGDEMSRLFAGYGARVLYAFIRDFKAGEAISLETREALLYASCAGGIAINKTGTGFPHPLGYVLTENYGVPHGMACAAFFAPYIDRCAEFSPEKFADFCRMTENIEDVKNVIASLTDLSGAVIGEENAKKYALRWQSIIPRNFTASPGGLTQEEAAGIIAGT